MNEHDAVRAYVIDNVITACCRGIECDCLYDTVNKLCEFPINLDLLESVIDELVWSRIVRVSLEYDGVCTNSRHNVYVRFYRIDAHIDIEAIADSLRNNGTIPLPLPLIQRVWPDEVDTTNLKVIQTELSRNDYCHKCNGTTKQMLQQVVDCEILTTALLCWYCTECRSIFRHIDLGRYLDDMGSSDDFCNKCKEVTTHDLIIGERGRYIGTEELILYWCCSRCSYGFEDVPIPDDKECGGYTLQSDYPCGYLQSDERPREEWGDFCDNYPDLGKYI